jgi:uncharacterized protein YbjT (DUF2867 family)
MKIVVIGGTGLIGSQVVNNLTQLGHEVIAASPASGVNTLTGEGVAETVAGATVVIDLANSPSFADKDVMEFFETSGRNLLTAEKAARVKHHIALSIVGSDRMPESGYMRAKVVQEKLIKESGIPYTIVHSTQFFEFLASIAAAATEGNIVKLSPALYQPIASADVARAVSDVAVGIPVNGIVEIGGPDKIGMAELVKKYLAKNNDPRQVVTDVHARYYGSELTDDMLVPGPDARIGSINFEQWYVNQPKKSNH